MKLGASTVALLVMAASLGPAHPTMAQTPSSTDGQSTKPSAPPAGMPGTAQQASSARMQIEASGYTDVKDLRRQDDGSWRARARKNDVEVAVSVDSIGNVTQIEQ
ncbi:MAG: PepSY domain-containing protein [Reyranella sp.]|jgi:hypothetical protein|nr:PepSY domain-containing protein [Reyranella sp.]